MYHIYSSSIFVLSAHFPFVFYLLVVHLKRLNLRVKLSFLPHVHSPGGGGGEGTQDFNRQG